MTSGGSHVLSTAVVSGITAEALRFASEASGSRVGSNRARLRTDCGIGAEEASRADVTSDAIGGVGNGSTVGAIVSCGTLVVDSVDISLSKRGAVVSTKAGSASRNGCQAGLVGVGADGAGEFVAK